jgi:Helix-turn-helix domain
VSSIEFHHNSLPSNQPSRSDSGDNTAFPHTKPEGFVDAATAAAFLSLSRKHVLKLARLGLIPAYPISFGTRSVWRFLLSELREWMFSNGSSPKAGDSRTIGDGGSRKGRA